MILSSCHWLPHHHIYHCFNVVIKGRTELRTQLDEASRDANTKYVLLEDVEKRSVRSALLEERSHLCFLASCLKPVLVCMVICLLM